MKVTHSDGNPNIDVKNLNQLIEEFYTRSPFRGLHADGTK
jgi:hypothetical protein